ncbi:MAG: peroxiredoxin family protein [Vampirovibrionales bacterium]|nr:peroxiredoxin family protein [Vampirovibrionales bacterium]
MYSTRSLFKALLALLLFLPVSAAFAEAGKHNAPPLRSASDISDSPSSNPYLSLRIPKPGSVAPGIQVKTAEGTTLTLTQYKGKKNVVLVFYQGHFCSVCAHQLANLQSHYGDFKLQEAEIIAISADSQYLALRTQGELGLSFPVVPDSAKSIIARYGVANVAKQGIAWPSAFIIDKQGKLRFSYADSRGHRLHSNELLSQLSNITGKPSPSLGYEE